jgi:predicted alpha-1,6-mannanase (GH76 family)
MMLMPGLLLQRLLMGGLYQRAAACCHGANSTSGVLMQRLLAVIWLALSTTQCGFAQPPSEESSGATRASAVAALELIADTGSGPGISYGARCNEHGCDEKDPGTAGRDVVLQQVEQWSRSIAFHVSYPDGMVWASIDNGSSGDEVWLDRSFDMGATWDGKLGDTKIPDGRTGWRSGMFVFRDSDQTLAVSRLRACGKAGDRDEIACTAWLPACTGYFCDGADPNFAKDQERDKEALRRLWGRKITLRVWELTPDLPQMAWASMEDAQPGDEVWLDRSWDGGASWTGKLGGTVVPEQQTGWRTLMYLFDDPISSGDHVMRACGRVSDLGDIACTAWTHGADRLDDVHASVADALVDGYFDVGSHRFAAPTWIAANAMTALLDYMDATNSCRHWDIVEQTYDKGGPFTNSYYDDSAWWALAWLRAHEVSARCAPGTAHSNEYLPTAERIYQYLLQGWDRTSCDGGVRWTTENFTKNAISNVLFFKVAAVLNRDAGDSGARDAAARQWDWLQARFQEQRPGASEPFLVLDAFACGGQENHANDNDIWTYNTGTLIGALTEYFPNVPLETAGGYVAHVMNPQDGLIENGALREIPARDGSGDESAFKGILVRNLARYYQLARFLNVPVGDLATFLTTQRDKVWQNSHVAGPLFHYSWHVKGDGAITAGSQIAALDAYNAAAGL